MIGPHVVFTLSHIHEKDSWQHDNKIILLTGNQLKGDACAALHRFMLLF